MARDTWRPSNAAWESPADRASLCCSRVLRSRGKQNILQSLESIRQVMKIRRWEQERALPHQPPPLIWGRRQAPVAAQTWGLTRGLSASRHVPGSKYFSAASAFVSVGGATPPTSAHRQGPLRPGLCRPHGSCLRRRLPDVSGNPFKEMKALLSLQCENSVTTSLLFSCSLFTRNFAILLLLFLFIQTWDVCTHLDMYVKCCSS